MDAFPDGTAYALIGGAVRTSKDFGETWSSLAPSGSLGTWQLDSMAMGTPVRGFAVGYPAAFRDDRPPGVYDGGALVTSDGTRTWRKYPIPRAPGADVLIPLAFDASPTGRAAVFAGHASGPGGVLPGQEFVWITSAGEMRRARLGQTTGGASAVALLDDRRAVAAVREYRPPRSTIVDCCAELSTVLYVTADAGRTWRRTSVVKGDEILTLDYLAPDLIIGGGWRTGNIYVSRNGTRTLSRVGTVNIRPPGFRQDGTHPPAVEIDFVTDRVGYAVTCLGGNWRTEDGGETWDLEVSPNHGDSYTSPRSCRHDTLAAIDQRTAIHAFDTGILRREPG